MNANRIKQIFTTLAKSLPEPGFRIFNKDGSSGPFPITESLVVRNRLVLYGDVADQFFESMEEINRIATADGTWNKGAIDNLVVQCLTEVAVATLETRPGAIRTQAARLLEDLAKPLSRLLIDLSVFGMHQDCTGLRFGRLEFISDRAQSTVSVPGLVEAGKDVVVLFARIPVDAINESSAVDQARGILEQHLAILNALCAQLLPSRTRLAHRTEQNRLMNVCRVTGAEEAAPAVSFEFQNLGILLNRLDCEAFLEKRGGRFLGELLLRTDSFARRLVSAFETAGLACVERRSHLSFLLFAIALESAVLGMTNKTELTFQLSSRVAHLLSADVSERRKLSATVSKLYDLRSKVVHTGETEVAESELEMIEHICLKALITIAASPGFAKMQSVEELEDWFQNRILGGE